MSGQDLIIRAERLSRHFGGVRAVDGLTLAVPRGTVFGFLGPNGSGKTTTIRLLLGLLEPTSGQATVLGFDTIREGAEIRQRVGALLEHHGLYERLSAADNLEFHARVWQLPAGERRARVRELLTSLGLWERRTEIVGKWSRGMKQKLAVARALLHRPSLVFLDEPTAGLDPVAAAALRDDLASLAATEGTTVFLTTHNLAEAEKLCSQVGVIREGRLLAAGTPDELRLRRGGPRLEIVGQGFDGEVVASLRTLQSVASAAIENGRLVVDLRGDASAAPIVAALAGAGVQIEEVRKGAASLEEAFLSLVTNDASDSVLADRDDAAAEAGK